MNALDLFQQGQLSEAISAQTAEVKSNPLDIDARHALSVYLCYAGELDRAYSQLTTIGKQNGALAMASNVYKSHLIADLQRRKVFNEDAKPLLPPNCAPHVEARLDALIALRRGDIPTASAALDRAAETEKGSAGKMDDGQSFDAIRDYDDILGSVLEIFAGETYIWQPFENIRRLKLLEPAHLLDLIYRPAEIEDVTGAEANVHIPMLYEGSHLAADGRLQAGQMTDWREIEGLGYRGVGQKVLLHASGDKLGEIGLRDLRTIEFVTSTSGES